MKPIFRQDFSPVAFLGHAESHNCTDLTVGDLKDTSLPNQDSKPDKSTTWTDEKHSLYLNHLESSFIEQLHRSMGLSRWRSKHETKGTTVSRKLSANEQHASEKLTVLQDGSWKKIELKRPISKSAAESRIAFKSPWLEHLGCADKRHIAIMLSHLQEQYLVPTGEKGLGRKRIFSNESATSSDQLPVSLSTKDQQVGCLEEFSDQNFAEDILEKSSAFMSKRSKTSVANASSHCQDQIVPTGKKSAPGHTLSKN